MNSIDSCELVGTWPCDSVADWWLPVSAVVQADSEAGVQVCSVGFSFKAVIYSTVMNTNVLLQHKNWNKTLVIVWV